MRHLPPCRNSLLGAGLCLAALLTTGGAVAKGAEPTNRQILPAGGIALLEIDRPSAWTEGEYGQRLAGIVAKSTAVARLLASPELDKLLDVLRELEAEWKVDWHTGLSGLTAGGIAVSLKPGPPQQVAAVITASDETLLSNYVASVLRILKHRVELAGQTYPEPARREQSGREFFQLGGLFYATSGRRLLLAGTEADMRGMLDRLGGAEGINDEWSAAPVIDVSAAAAAVRLTVNLKAVRQVPDIEKFLRLPTDNPGLLAFFGGWVDLAKRSDYAAAALLADESGWELRMRLPAGTTGVTPGLAGFFGARVAAPSAPLLQPADMFYTASWYRDYASLWEARGELVTPEIRQMMETNDAEQIKQSGGPGLIAIIKALGPHYRVVACRQPKLGYAVELPDKLPAMAIAVDLRDPVAFDKQVLPPIQKIITIVGLVNKLFSRKSTYRDADLYGLRYPDDPQVARGGNRLRYNFEYTYTVTRGHLIVGSTSAVVRNVIDELDRLAASASPAETAPVEMQQLLLSGAAEAVHDVEEASIRQLVLQQGLTVSEVERELEIFRELLKALDRVTVSATFTEQAFEYVARVGPAGKAATSTQASVSSAKGGSTP